MKRLAAVLVLVLVAAGLAYLVNERFKALPGIETGTGEGERLRAPEEVPQPSMAAPEKKTAAAEEGVQTGGPPPTFDVVRIDPDGHAVMAGRAAGNSEVTILDKGEEIGKVTADSHGEWVWVPPDPLKPGNLELSLRARHPDGSVAESKSRVVLIVPEPHKDIAGRESEEASGALVLKVPDEGGASEVVQKPEGDPGAADRLALDAVDYDEAGKLALSGRAKPGSKLRLYLDNALMGETETSDLGRWVFNSRNRVPPGNYRLRIDEIGGDGKVTARIELPFTSSQRIAGLTEGSVVVQPGNSLWRIARRTYGHGMSYTVIYNANKGQIRDPDLIYPGQVFSLPAGKAAQ